MVGCSIDQEMKPLLTIIVPVYNRARLVVRTLDSIAASTSCAFNLIIVDNGSTDDSLATCQSWAELHQEQPFSIDILSCTTLGAPAARNEGLRHAQTPYVYFFDSDDVFSRDFVEAILPWLEKGKWDMVFVPVRQRNEQGALSVRSYQMTDSPAVQILNSMLSTQSLVFRTDWLRSIGGWREGLPIWQDWELGIRALAAHPQMTWCTQRTYHEILIHPDSISGKSMADTWRQSIQTMSQVLRFVQNDMADASDKEYCLRALYWRAMLMCGLQLQTHHAEGAATYTAFAQREMPRQRWSVRFLGSLIKCYTHWGGRGAWRLALYFIRK